MVARLKIFVKTLMLFLMTTYLKSSVLISMILKIFKKSVTSVGKLPPALPAPTIQLFYQSLFCLSFLAMFTVSFTPFSVWVLGLFYYFLFFRVSVFRKSFIYNEFWGEPLRLDREK